MATRRSCCSLSHWPGPWHKGLTEAARGEAGERRSGLLLAGGSRKREQCPAAESYQHQRISENGTKRARTRGSSGGRGRVPDVIPAPTPRRVSVWGGGEKQE